MLKIEKTNTGTYSIQVNGIPMGLGNYQDLGPLTMASISLNLMQLNPNVFPSSTPIEAWHQGGSQAVGVGSFLLQSNSSGFGKNCSFTASVQWVAPPPLAF